MSRALRTATLAVATTVAATTTLVVGTAPPGVSAPAPAPDERQAASLEVGPAHAFSRFAFGHDQVVDRQGNTTIVWTRSVARPVVLASHRPAGGDWGARVAIGRGFVPTVDADRRGRVTAVWQTRGNALMAARMRLDGSWGPAARLTPPVDAGEPGRLRGVDLAVAPGGRATVAWAATTGVPDAPRRLYWARRQPGAGWGAPVPVGAPGHPEEPQVAVTAHAVTTLLYGVQRLGSARSLVARDHVPGEGWTAPTRLGRGGYSSELGVDRAGNAIVALDPGPHRVVGVYRSAGQDWRRPRTLTPDGVEVEAFDLDVNRAGDVIVAWSEDDGDIGASRRSATAPWTGPDVVAPTGRSAAFVSTAMGAGADALVAWGSFAVSAAHQPEGAEWSEPTSGISNRNLVLEDLRTTAAPDGSTVVAYKQEDTALRTRDVRPVP